MLDFKHVIDEFEKKKVDLYRAENKKEHDKLLKSTKSNKKNHTLKTAAK